MELAFFWRMTRVFLLLCAWLWATAARADELEASFKNPPAVARPQTWWHWMNGNVSRAGITADLEAMKSVGLGGFQQFDVTDRMPPGTVDYLSAEWRELMKHSLREAERLGLEVCFHNCAGWSSSGGPWITPEFSKQEVVWSEVQVRGATNLDLQLKQPAARLGYYRDIAVLAFPTPQSERGGKEGFRIQDWKAKAGFVRSNTIKPDARPVEEQEVIAKNSIINLSARMTAAGRLEWQVPPGEWTIVRFGHTTTGGKNHPAPKAGEGLESDKLSVAASELHWKNAVQKVLDDAGPLVGKTLSTVLIDSYEAGTQNWTRDFSAQFQQRTGYDLTLFLPALTGRVVERLPVSERFLWDFRRVIADLMAENYFGHFAKMCHRNGLKLEIEPYGDGSFNDFEIADLADVPMGEWWAMRSADWCHGSSKMAASAAHTAGRRFVGAEAFTARRPAAAFQCSPALLKAQGDYFSVRA